MDWIVVALSAVLGLAFGSFGNVVVHRVPQGRSVSAPRSACPGCGEPIAARDNIPVVSWLLLRGRCRRCGQPISLRYPALEAVTALLFAAVAARIGLDWSLPGFLLLTWLLVVCAVIDAETRKIPNRLTYPLTPLLLVLFVAAGLLSGAPGAALRSVAGGVLASGFLLLLALVNPRGMGMGDVKLAASIGLGLGYLGWGHLVVGLFGAFVLGGLVASLLLLTRLRRRSEHIPFGPYLAVGALVALLAGGAIVDGYLRLSGLA